MKMKHFTWIAACLLLFASCTQDEWENASGIGTGGEGVRLVFKAESMGLVETRADGETCPPETSDEADSRIEHVIVYAFTEDGTRLVERYQQDLEYPDNELSVALPQDEGNLLLHAVCNYEPLWSTNIQSVADLESQIVEIDEPDGTFNGSMIMHGKLTMSEQDIKDRTKENIICVKRIAARIDLTLMFNPENPTDKFYLSNIKVYDIPMRSYLVEKPQTAEKTGDDATILDGKPFGEYFYNDGMLLQTVGDDLSTPSDNVTSTFYLFENRRGTEPDDIYEYKYTTDGDHSEENSIWNMWQTMKAGVAKKYFDPKDYPEDATTLTEMVQGAYPHATYLVISGTYITDNGNTTQSATYTIYLGKNNYSDFNVTRNCKYAVTATIRTCNDLDTRVDAVTLNKPEITGSFNNPLDAHFNVGRCFGFTANRGGWELYVENPDEHPWLEVSLSSTYRPNIPGKKYEDAEGNTLAPNMIASSRIVGEGAMSGYFYVHTDEYVPDHNAEGDNNIGEESWRSGTIVLRDLTTRDTTHFVVYQRPAQYVKMHVDQLIGSDFDNEYFVEYELEQKNITWGFLMYGANPVMTSMINDRWDGLSNTRKLYQEAIKIPEDPDDESEDSGIYWGAYNGYYTVEDTYKRETDIQKVIDRIPDDHLIKYVLSKNRDRNGNGYIDYDEIVWYVPALDELAELYRVLENKTVFFQNSEDRFHSSTPYLAGYTAEVPGRAFYVKMGDKGEKAFAMRDRQYNVICCRRKGAWTGNADSGFTGDVSESDDPWEDETDIMPK